jgi:hypothetical protein
MCRRPLDVVPEVTVVNVRAVRTSLERQILTIKSTYHEQEQFSERRLL